MRPRTLDEFVGQEHLLGEDKTFRRLIEKDRVSSLISGGLRVPEKLLLPI